MRKKLFIVFLILYLFLVFWQVGKYFEADEAGMAGIASAISGGEFNYYESEERSSISILWHPPMYFLVSGFVVRIFGLSEMPLRLLSVISNLVTVYFIYKISKNISKNENVPYLAVIVFTLIPMVVQGSLLLDIDNSLLTVFTMMFLYFFTKDMKNPNTLLLGFVLGIAMFTKLITPFVLLFSVFAYYMYKRQFQTGLITTLKISLWTLMTFVTLFGTFCFLSNQSPLTIIERLAVGDRISGFNATHILYSLRSLIVWTTPSIFISFLFLKNIGDGEKLLLFAIMMLLFYTLVIAGTPYGFPRYYYPILPTMSILFAMAVEKYLIQKNLDKFIPMSLLILLFFIYVIIPFNPFEIDPRAGYSIAKSLLSTLLYTLPICIPFGILFLYKDQNFYDKIIFSSFIAFVSISTFVNITHAFADYNTIYNYGESGVLEVAEYLKNNTTPNEMIISTEDVSFYANRRFYDIQRDTTMATNISALMETLEKYNIRYVIVSNFTTSKHPMLSAYLDHYLIFDKKIESFYVYRS